MSRAAEAVMGSVAKIASLKGHGRRIIAGCAKFDFGRLPGWKVKPAEIVDAGGGHHARAPAPTLTTPCALLKDHACSVYHARPANCRHAVSTSVEVCKRAYVEMSGEAIPVPGIFVGMTFVAQTALAAALVRCGLPTRAYELSAAVNRAVVQPELETRWLVGRGCLRRSAARSCGTRALAKTSGPSSPKRSAKV